MRGTFMISGGSPSTGAGVPSASTRLTLHMLAMPPWCRRFSSRKPSTIAPRSSGGAMPPTSYFHSPDRFMRLPAPESKAPLERAIPDGAGGDFGLGLSFTLHPLRATRGQSFRQPGRTDLGGGALVV